MNEMRDLIETVGMELVGEVTQRMNEVNPKTYIGTGKVKEAQTLLTDLDSCTVVFDAELTPGQQKSLENTFNKEILQNDFLGTDEIVSTTFVFDILPACNRTLNHAGTKSHSIFFHSFL